jgi:hypothetical protein
MAQPAGMAIGTAIVVGKGGYFCGFESAGIARCRVGWTSLSPPPLGRIALHKSLPSHWLQQRRLRGGWSPGAFGPVFALPHSDVGVAKSMAGGSPVQRAAPGPAM